LDQGYEGAVIRNPKGIYRTRIYSQHRSYDVQKLKPLENAEFEVVGYDQGKKGKNVGAIKFKLKTETGKVFNAEPKNMTQDERYRLFEKMSEVQENGKTYFENEYLGKPYTVEYFELSKDGVPQQPKGLGLRDPRTI
jgi:ATP-dependent DNA ligase